MNSEKQPFDYLNFDLLIERAGNAYVARVTNSPAGEAATKFNVPFSALELENFLLKIGRPRRGGAPAQFAGNGRGQSFWQAPL